MKATIQLKPMDGSESFTYNCRWKDVIEVNGRVIKAHDLRANDYIVAKGKICNVKNIIWKNW
jgi:hypothetical protein